MTYSVRVYLLVLSGKLEEGEASAVQHFPGREIVHLSKRRLREIGWRGVARELWKLKGEALFIYVQDSSRLEKFKLITLFGLVHRCRLTVLADGEGHSEALGRWQLLFRLPRLAIGLSIDLVELAGWWVALRVLLRPTVRPIADDHENVSDLDVAVLYPFPFQETMPGGEMSYLKGVLSGFAQESVNCEVISGCELPFDIFPIHVVPSQSRLYILPESVALSYNLRFVYQAWKRLRNRRPRFLYQRHGRFVVVGAVLSQILKIPLVLEYQCSELWRARNWDPARFFDWMRRCEDATIRASWRVVALSDVLRNELMEYGVPAGRIVVNPAGVDPELFQPGSSRPEVRDQLGFCADNVVVGFVGSFAYFHGITVLEQAIRLLLERRHESSLHKNMRFLLVGDGLLWPEISNAVKLVDEIGAVHFTGRVPHHSIPGLLDACDIMVCAHIPPEDGTRFFGSPSKLFEYMAMKKAIVASDLEQISQVLEHQVTACLVPPGNAEKLATAIELQASDPELRQRLGEQARATVLKSYTWRGNAARLLAEFRRTSVRGASPGTSASSPLIGAQSGRIDISS